MLTTTTDVRMRDLSHRARGGGLDQQVLPIGGAPLVSHSVWLLFLYRALDSHPFFPLHVASGCCFLSAAAAGALAGVISAFAEPSSWCVGAVLNVAWCAICASAAPNSWRIEDVLVVAGVVWLFLLSTRLCPQAVHSLPCCVSVCVRPRCPVPPRTVPAVHHMSFSPSQLVCP